jgi:RNA polymerase sigma-70 factor, ECF subfamily
LQAAPSISSWILHPAHSAPDAAIPKAIRVSDLSSDAELIDASMDGNDNAFRFVVERFMDDVSRTVTGMLGPVPEVDDVVQEVFIKLHRSLASFRGDASLKTFVVRMAINKSLDALRKRKRAAWLKPWTDVQEFEHQTTEGSDTEITSRERRSELRNAINKLPENQRAVIVLRLIEDISTEETSRILDVPYGTVLSRLKRGLDRLRIELGESALIN